MIRVVLWAYYATECPLFMTTMVEDEDGGFMHVSHCKTSINPKFGINKERHEQDSTKNELDASIQVT